MNHISQPSRTSSRNSSKNAGSDTAKICSRLRMFFNDFVGKYGETYPFKDKLSIEYTPSPQYILIHTECWTVVIEAFEGADSHMLLSTPDSSLCLSCDDELDLITAIKDHRYEFTQVVNQ